MKHFKSYNYTSQSTESNPLLLVKHKIENPISFSSLTFSGTKQRLNANLFKYGFYKIDLCNDDRSEIQIWSSNSDNEVSKKVQTWSRWIEATESPVPEFFKILVTQYRWDRSNRDLTAENRIRMPMWQDRMVSVVWQTTDLHHRLLSARIGMDKINRKAQGRPICWTKLVCNKLNIE